MYTYKYTSPTHLSLLYIVFFSLAKENSPHHIEIVHLIPLAFAIYPWDIIVLPYQCNFFLKANAFKRLLTTICCGLKDYRLKYANCLSCNISSFPKNPNFSALKMCPGCIPNSFVSDTCINTAFKFASNFELTTLHVFVPDTNRSVILSAASHLLPLWSASPFKWSVTV